MLFYNLIYYVNLLFCALPPLPSPLYFTHGIIFYQNVRGLRTRVNDVYLSSLAENYDIIALTETWLNSGINSCELFSPRYNVYRQDRDNVGPGTTRGGGVLLAVDKSIMVERVTQHEIKIEGCENIWVKLRGYSNKHKTLYVAVYYLAPNTPLCTYKKISESIIRLVSDGIDMLILGDFNVPFFYHWYCRGMNEVVRKSSDMMRIDARSAELIDLVHVAGLRSHNKIVNHQNRTLDLVLSNLSTLSVLKGDSLITCTDAYHPPIEIKLDINGVTRYSKSTNSLPTNIQNSNRNNDSGDKNWVNCCELNYAKADFRRLYKGIKDIDWEPLYKIMSSDEAAEYLNDKMYGAVRGAVPIKKIRSGNTHKYPIWFNKNVIKMIRAKERCRRKLRKNETQELQAQYRRMRAMSKKMIKEAYREYVKSTEYRINTEPQKFWIYVNSKRKDVGTTTIMKHANREYSHPEDIANAFAEYFSSVYVKKQPLANLKGNTRNVNIVSLRRFFESEIETAMIKLKPKRGVGPDGIPPYIYKACKELLVAPLTHVCNTILKTKVYPRSWTVSKVTPIPKGLATSDVQNYRPIAIPPVPAKIFESAIFLALYQQTLHKIPSQQHGFVKGRSIPTNLVELTHYVAQIHDRGLASQVDVIYTDFQKAFDKVDHDILFSKLDTAGYSEALLELFKSYLQDRKQYVVCKGRVSNLYECPSGVPQGSNLGPYLFLLYISDIQENLCHSKCLLYADDLKMYREINNERDQQLLQQDLNELAKWGDENRLPLNINKCSKVTFTRRPSPISTTYSIRGEVLHSQEKVKDLGVILRSDLNFTDQVQSTINKANRNMGIIMRHSRLLSREGTMRTLYFALVRSHLDFAGAVSLPVARENLKRMERIQKRFLKHLYFSDFGYHEPGITYRELVLGYGLTTFKVRKELNVLLFLRDIVNSKIMSTSLLEKITFFIPPRISRKPNNIFSVSRCRTAYFESAPLNRAQMLYGRVVSVDESIDIFFDSRKTFVAKVTAALEKICNP